MSNILPNAIRGHLPPPIPSMGEVDRRGPIYVPESIVRTVLQGTIRWGWRTMLSLAMTSPPDAGPADMLPTVHRSMVSRPGLHLVSADAVDMDTGPNLAVWVHTASRGERGRIWDDVIRYLAPWYRPGLDVQAIYEQVRHLRRLNLVGIVRLHHGQLVHQILVSQIDMRDDGYWIWPGYLVWAMRRFRRPQPALVLAAIDGLYKAGGAHTTGWGQVDPVDLAGALGIGREYADMLISRLAGSGAIQVRRGPAGRKSVRIAWDRIIYQCPL